MEGKCPVCGAPLENGKCGYCQYSAQPIQQQQNVYTQNANEAPQPQVIIQPQQPQHQPQYVRTCSPKSKITALLLCIFLGYFGIHRFYVGKVGTGIIWFFTFGLFGFGWVIDIVLIAAGAFTDSAGLALKM